MALSTQPYKGARDFYPEDKRLQKYIFGKLREVVEGFGYQEYDAPLLEPLEIYAAKSGEELVNEQLYSFEDKGGRQVAIRPEMTPSLARMVAARRQELAYPLRLYSIPNLWRYERPQRGRLREHWQLNVDLFGIEGTEADMEIIHVANSVLKAFGATKDMYKVKISSRKLNDAIFTAQGLNDDDKKIFTRINDKWEKFDSDDQRGEYIHDVLKKSGYNDSQKQDLIDKIGARGDLFDNAVQGPAGQKLLRIKDFLQDLGVDVELDQRLSRGFEYYDDIIFEFFDSHPENNRSMFGGGRYDGLVGLFGVEPVPTVGFGMGDVTLQHFLESHELLPRLTTETDAVVILIGDVYDPAQGFLNKFRSEGLKLAVDSSGRKVDAQIKSAAKSGVHYALFIGEQELKDERFKLKDLSSGEEEDLSFERVVSALAARHQQNGDLS